MEGIKSCLTFWGIWKGQIHQGIPERKVYGNDWMLAPTTGVLQAHCELGDKVHQGDEVATIKGSRGQVLTELLAPKAGVILGLRRKAYVRQGDWAVLVGTELKA